MAFYWHPFAGSVFLDGRHQDRMETDLALLHSMALGFVYGDMEWWEGERMHYIPRERVSEFDYLFVLLFAI